ncbi:MAG TPA: hypothetical protein VN446_08075 [Candidatus Acidoferrum sp.]|nr:hypothetical protein [Candidatus Acidoferrum sp.]
MKVLFIGNSHTFVNDMPELLRQLAASRGVEIDAVQNTSGGRGLGWHAHEFDVRYNILFGRYDYVVLQHTAHPFPGVQNLFEETDKILNMTALSQSKPVAYQCWSEKNNPDGHTVICEAYEKLAHERDMLLAPVGRAWAALRDRYALYYKDGEHTSPMGAYLSACVFFVTLTGASAVGLPTAFTFTAPTYDPAAPLEAAWETPEAGPRSLTLDPAFCLAAQKAADAAVDEWSAR